MPSLQPYCAANSATSARGLAAKVHSSALTLRRIILAAELRRGFKASGGAVGPLGLPIDAVAYHDDGAIRPFRGGTIRTMSDGSGTSWGDARRVRVDYVGFECLSESNEWSGSDEPYFLLALIGPKASSVIQVGPIDNVDAGDKRTEGAGPVAVDFVPNELALSIIIRENDQGSPDEAKQKIVAKAAEIAQVAGTIYGIVEGDADVGSGASDWITKVPAVGTVAGWMSGLFGMGDDTVGGAVKRLFTTIENFKAPTTPPVLGDFMGNQYNYVTDVIGSSSQGKYKIYFLITVYTAPSPPTPV